MNKIQPQKNNGFALILALLVSSVALAVGLSLLDITVKQLTLSSTVRESEIAFQAAAAGINCIQTARNRYVYQTEDAVVPEFYMECLDQEIRMDDTNTSSNRVQEFTSEIDWTTPSGTKLCIQMEMLVLNAAKPTAAVVNATAGNGESLRCDARDVCTFAFSRGYNRSCTDVGNGALFSVQREITAEF